MPPSGFDRKTTGSAVAFVSGCFEDLKQEANRSGREIQAAIEHELSQIKKALQGDVPDLERGLLLFVEAAYILALETGIEEALEQIRSRIAEMHVDQNGSLTRRIS
jgi:hypothetical protein